MTVALGAPRLGTDVRVDAEALVFQGVGRPFERIGVPTVVLHHGEVLVEVELALICPTDVRADAHGPVVLGHEAVGRVVAIGPGRPPRSVDGHTLAIGDRVVWGVAVDCGRCGFCHAGDLAHCRSLRVYGSARVSRGWELSGAFASHVHLLSRTPIVRVPEQLAAAVLAQAPCATAAVAAALEPIDLREAVVVVVGAGLRGLTAIAMARDAGATVIAVDGDRDRRELAIRFGADAALDEPPAEGVVVELRGSPRYAPRHLSQAVEFLARTPLPFCELVGDSFTLDDAERAFGHASADDVTRVALRPSR